MNIDITLQRNTIALSTVNSIALPENELKLNIIPGIFADRSIVVVARNGTEEIKTKPRQFTDIDISSLLLPGKIELEIIMLSGVEPVKNWRVQDIFVKEIDGKYEPIPIIEELKGAINEIKGILIKNNLL